MVHCIYFVRAKCIIDIILQATSIMDRPSVPGRSVSSAPLPIRHVLISPRFLYSIPSGISQKRFFEILPCPYVSDILILPFQSYHHLDVLLIKIFR